MQVQGKNNQVFNVKIIRANEKIWCAKVITDDQVLGEVSFKIVQGRTWIFSISTNSSFQHTGVGQALMDVCEYISLRRRSRTIEGKYIPSNEHAKPFYLKNGFEIYKDGYEWFIIKYCMLHNKAKIRLKELEEKITEDNNVVSF